MALSADIQRGWKGKLRDNSPFGKDRRAAMELAIAQEVEQRAKSMAPVDHGALRGSIESGSDSEGAFVKTNREYAAFQEFGTLTAGARTDPGPTPGWYKHGGEPGGVPSQPYLRPALFEVVGRVPDLVKRSQA